MLVTWTKTLLRKETNNYLSNPYRDWRTCWNNNDLYRNTVSISPYAPGNIQSPGNISKASVIFKGHCLVKKSTLRKFLMEYTIKCKLWLKCMFYSAKSHAQYLCLPFCKVQTSLLLTFGYPFSLLHLMHCIPDQEDYFNRNSNNSISAVCVWTLTEVRKRRISKEKWQKLSEGQQSQPIPCLTAKLSPTSSALCTC